MVKQINISNFRFYFLFLLIMHLPLLLSGCGPAARVSVAPDFKLSADQDYVYVVPFATILVPELFSESMFNDFVDHLNDNRGKAHVKEFVILKEALKTVDPAWLAKKTYVTGEIWSYIENSGCCQTELRVKGKIHLHSPGKPEPAMEIYLPMESFFDHDKSTLTLEQEKLAKRMAREMANRLIAAVSTHP